MTATEPPVCAAIRGGVGKDVGSRLEAGGRADPHVHPGDGAAEQVGVRHVVGAVAEVGEGQPGQVALVLADGLQVGQDLAGVERRRSAR